MKYVTILSLFFVGTMSYADIIKCVFNEPFIDTEYSMTTRNLTITDFFGPEENPKRTTVIKNVSFQIKGPGLFQLISDKKKVLQTLTLNNNGTDGMSENIYPYSVKYNGFDNLIGGCESNYLHKKIIKDSNQ